VGASPAAALGADRYVIALSASGTSISRCTGPTCPTPLATSSTSFIATSSPSTPSPVSSLRVDVAYASASASSVVVYGFSSGGAHGDTSAATATLTVSDSTAGAQPTLLSLGVAASAAGVRFSGLCFANAAVAAGSLFAIAGGASPSTAALTATANLNHEAQPAGFGLEVQVTDAPAAGSSSSAVFNMPGPLSEFFTALVAVGDVNEAPLWPALVSCAAPTSANVYANPPATLDTASAFFAACFYVPENSSPSSFAALAAQALPAAADPDVAWSTSHPGQTQSLLYSLAEHNNAVAGGGSVFAVGAVSGRLSVLAPGGAGALNFESPLLSLYALTAVVVDTIAPSSAPFASLSASQPVALYVTDVNEAPAFAAQACSVQEQTLFMNAPPGAVVSCNGVFGGALVASDPDTPLSLWANLTFTIVGGNSLGLFAVSTVGSASGVLTLTSAVTCCSGAFGLASSLDFESASGNVFSLLVRVTDGGGLSASATVTVSLVDVNEPPALLAPFARTLTENLVGPQRVGAPLGVYDADSDQREFFAITSGNGSSWFEVDPCSGQLWLLAGKWLDYEAVQSGYAASYAPLTFVVGVTVTDSGAAPITGALTASASYVILIADADDPPVFITSSLSVTIPENSAAPSAVSALVTVTDQDVFGGRVAWFNQTFAIVGGNAQGIFAASTPAFLTASSAGGGPNALRITVLPSEASAATLLNFEDPNQKNFALLVTATDGGGATASATVLVAVTDVNEAPFFQASETLVRSVDEMCAATCAPRAAGDAVFSASVMASDPDTQWTPAVDASKSWQSLTFELLGGGAGLFSVATVQSAQGSFAAGARVVLTATGALAASLDYEATPSYALQLRVRDSLGLYADATLTLNVINRNEPPVFNSVFSPQPGTNLALPAFFVMENVANLASVGAALSAVPGLVDPEDALGAGLSVSISGGSGQNVFGIVASTGQLYVAAPLKFETAQSYSLTLAL
jgi:hypothetical protein